MTHYALALILSLVAHATPERCVSTMFGQPGDRWVGGKAIALGRRVNSTDLGIAHRSRPVGALIAVVRGDRWVLAPVIDRGPYGARVACEAAQGDPTLRVRRDGSCWYVKRNRRAPGKWRGCADLTPATGAIIHHRGFDRVTVWGT